MKVIIPTFNRSAKLARTLECYSLGDYNIEKMVVIDGSNDEHKELNVNNCRRLGFDYLHFDPELDLVARLHEYLSGHCSEELICLGDHVRTRVKVCGNDQLVVKIPNSSDHSDLKEGATVKLSWKSGDTRALDFKA